MTCPATVVLQLLGDQLSRESHRRYLLEIARPATAQVLARLRVSISSRPAVADVRRQWGMEDPVGLEIELGDAVEYPLAGPE
jgi:hypothetical protein